MFTYENARYLFLDIVNVSWSLFRVMIPTIIIVKILTILGLVDLLAHTLAPLMMFLGLPAEAAIVLTTTMLTNPYAGLMVFATTPELQSLSVAQTTTMASFMLVAHSLPVECAIMRRAGLRLRVSVMLRVFMAFTMGFLVYQISEIANLWTDLAIIQLPSIPQSSSLAEWVYDQFMGLIFIQIVIAVLLCLLALLRAVKIEHVIHQFMGPFLRMMNISNKASHIAVIGVTLGVGFGGGILIKEVDSQKIDKKDVFGVLIFVGLLHSIFEDTAVAMLIGPNLWVILFGRIFLAVLVTILLTQLCRQAPLWVWRGYLTNRYAPELTTR
ncbi:MAG: nucleoside recognition domain-containing protein [Alphaproteobacteria bacterium]